jgi:hypothetical protein
VGASGGTIDVATANVQDSLGADGARRALVDVLSLEPDLVALQEWYPARVRILAETGRVGLAPHLGIALPVRATGVRSTYLWNAPLLGGCVVGARSDRFALLGCRTRLLSRPGLRDRDQGRRRLEPGRAATVAIYRDRQVGRTVCLVSYHLVSGVQVSGRYRSDRPLLVAQHRRESDVLQALVREQLARGHIVHAAGDSNFDGQRIGGLTSAWEGREDHFGTLGPRRKVDDVHGPGPAEAVTLVATGSDHHAIVVRRHHREGP